MSNNDPSPRDHLELRDTEQARLYLLHGLWLQRVVPPLASSVSLVLQWALELAANGHPLPPVGLVADLGHTVFGLDRGERRSREAVAVPGWPAGLTRSYEDHVLGKFYADWTFDQAAGALRQYEGRDRARGLAFLIEQFRQRAGFPGVHLSPAVIKGLRHDPPDRTLAAGWESLEQRGVMPLLPALYESLIAAVRRMTEVLGGEDVFALERRTALARLGEHVALRQVLHWAGRLEGVLPRHRVRPRSGRQEVPTRILDEDTYPVGGFAALSTRGSVESLLHSQLAYMEKEDRPDLFDVKFLRDELLYYSRDDNQFLRRRRSFVFALFPDLVGARFKDADLPCQRIILLLALLVTALRKLSEWLSTDALLFEFAFIEEQEPGPLKAERDLLEMLLREQIANGTVKLLSLASAGAVQRHCEARAQRSLCHCLPVATTDQPLEAEATVVTRLVLDGPCPALASAREALSGEEVDGPVEGWGAALETLLELWV